MPLGDLVTFLIKWNLTVVTGLTQSTGRLKLQTYSPKTL